MSRTASNLLLGLAIASFAIAWSDAPETRTLSFAAATAFHNFQANVTALRSPDGIEPAFVFAGP